MQTNKELKSASEATEELEAVMDRAIIDGRYMVVVWSVDAEQELKLLKKIMWSFPSADQMVAVSQLRALIRSEEPPREELPVRPLPVALIAQENDSVVIDVDLQEKETPAESELDAYLAPMRPAKQTNEDGKL